jgi:hypothetical protein
MESLEPPCLGLKRSSIPRGPPWSKIDFLPAVELLLLAEPVPHVVVTDVQILTIRLGAMGPFDGV